MNKRIKNILFIALIASLTHSVAVAQHREGPVAERIEAMKAAFITDRLRLSPEEAQQFWPLYNEYEAEEKALREKFRPEHPLSDLTDAQAQKVLDDMLEMESQRLELKRKYIEELQSVIPARKVAMLQKAEEEFKIELLRRLQNRRPPGRNRR